ncbi:DUF2489 domain-containing protein [Flocculibacter collagenilyticus]|uniref:DUF2489 domain-containing protein n=1 Tax=Flocculibacter collagenilyticus TaxID=2744479 RepID=UPI0018F69EF2|nr:DUF2489 domain-containing protein [Flocculibacter collagenilyticus]
MNAYWLIAIVIGASIIAALSYYAGKLLWQVKQQSIKQQKQQQAALAKREERKESMRESIVFIAKAMLEKQCEMSEGCLRIWMLLEYYLEDPKPDYQRLYPGVFAMYDAIKDMPTHEARNKYSKKEIRKMDMERYRAEDKHEEQVVIDLEQLIVSFDRPSTSIH